MLDAEPPNVGGARETARRNIRDGNRAAEVVSRLRALFAKKPFTTEALDLNAATREVMALCANELQGSRVQWQAEFAPEPLTVAGDRVQLQQVILNLVLNAIEAMGTVEDRPRVLVVSTARDDGLARLSVQDTGTGFAAADAERLFDAFYTTKPEGMGIGLSVSRSIVERHHGRIRGAANQGPGATFTFTVPLLVAGAPRGGKLERRAGELA
jgi:signal transduction histidine kinase